MRPFNTGWILSGLFVGALAFVGCGKHEKPNFTYMPDMAYTPALKAQAPGSMKMPPPGTLARGKEVYYYADNPDGAGRDLRNPLRKTKTVLMRGQEMYNIYCMVCHGQYGEGDGSVVPKFPRPPTLQSDKVRGWPDGRIYHVITQGQNLMPSYASSVEPQDRWAIVHYLRVIHRAKNPTGADLKALENW